jgi:glycosyltransferase involved in cell wall biosynthesis
MREMTHEAPTPSSPGINVIGILSTGTGLGAAGRSTLSVLNARKIAHVAIDLGLSGHATMEPIPTSAPRFSALSGLPYGVSVFQLNPDSFDNLVLRWARRTGLDRESTLNAIVPFWELPRIPESWVPLLELFDVVLAPTRFVHDAVLAGVSGEMMPNIIEYPQAIRPPHSAVPDRTRWFKNRADRTTFLCTFDILSDIERKNPWASIEAFQAAFAGRDDVSLVVKVGNANTARHAERFARLRELAARDERIALMTEHLSRDDLWSLSASADAYVSLHRAEGLGLGMMEAMSVGTPTVATGWSGNLDFMDSENSILIPYTLIPVSDVSHPLYAGEHGQQWADPDIDAAAKALRSLADSPELRARLGEAARVSMEERWRRQAVPGVFDELLELAASGLTDTPLHAARVKAAKRYVREKTYSPAAVLESAKRTGGRLLRRVGLKPPYPPDHFHWGPPEILS